MLRDRLLPQLRPTTFVRRAYAFFDPTVELAAPCSTQYAHSHRRSSTLVVVAAVGRAVAAAQVASPLAIDILRPP